MLEGHDVYAIRVRRNEVQKPIAEGYLDSSVRECCLARMGRDDP
jgi:hypothetical protein